MKEMAQHTKLGPQSRIDALLKFNHRLALCPKSKEVLKDWGLKLDPELVKIPARIMAYPSLIFGNDNKSVKTIFESLHC